MIKSIRYDSREINLHTLNILLGQVDFSDLERRDRAVINLETAGFIDPSGLIGVALLVRYAASLAGSVYSVLPASDSVVSYMKRMNLFSAISGFSDFDRSRIPEREYERRSSEVLLELSAIREEEDIAPLLRSLYQLLIRNALLSRESSSSLCAALSEVCQNIPQHSRDFGYVAAQIYGRSSGGEVFVKMAVGDMGIGIRESLKGTAQNPDISDEDAIDEAIKVGVSRYKISGRGLGLSRVRTIVNRFGGQMTVRSGSGQVTYYPDRILKRRVPFFPGTQITLELSARADSKLEQDAWRIPSEEIVCSRYIPSETDINR